MIAQVVEVMLRFLSVLELEEGLRMQLRAGDCILIYHPLLKCVIEWVK
jgi:hypothetical protein